MEPNKEKVIKGLECCHNPGSENGGCLCNCSECPYNPPDDEDWTQTCQVGLNRDALFLLKEQEPVKAYHLHNAKISTYEEIVFTHMCGNCNGFILKSWKACPICGKAVKWE